VLVRADSAVLARVRDTAQWVDHAMYVNGGQVRLFVNGRLLADHIDRAAALPRTGVVCSRAGDDASSTVRAARDRGPRARAASAGPLAAPSTSVRFRKHVISHEFVSEGSLQATSTRTATWT
jgi:hypothetical protein